jgi:hypothetical protein
MSANGPGTRPGRGRAAATAATASEQPVEQSPSPVETQDQHTVLLNTILATLTRVNERLDALENGRGVTPVDSEASEESSVEQADIPTVPAVTIPRATPNLLRDPKMPPPEPFSGKISEFKNFMVQCTLIFSVCPNTYCTDERRVLFVISRLKDEPLTWANEIAIDPAHPLRHDYDRFKQQLTNIYGDRAFKAKSEDQLLSIRQTGSAASYAQKFQSYAAPLNLNDDAKCLMFFGGLKNEIQKACTMAGRAFPFYALVDQAITFDQLSYQHSKQEKRESNSRESTGKKQRHSDNASTKDSSSTSPSNPKSTSSGNTNSSSQPRGPLTQAEKDHRAKHKLCMYCGKPGHTVQDCSAVPNSPKPSDSSSGSASVSNLRSPPALMYPVPLTSGSENWQSQPPRT